MNAHAPPKREGACSTHAPDSQKLRLAQCNSLSAIAQVGWFTEAERLLAEYERTDDARHFIALSKHVSAMFELDHAK